MGALVDHVLDEGKRLYGFSKPHLIGEYAAKSVLIKEIEIGDPLYLVGAQGCLQPFGHGDLCDFVEVSDIVTQLAPEGIHESLGKVFEDIVKDGSLVLLELVLRWSGGVESQYFELMREFFEPGFRQAGIGAVFQLHIAFALEPCLPDAIQRQVLPFVLHGDVEGEPLVLFVAFHACVDNRRRCAHLVSGKGGLAVNAPVFEESRVGIQQKRNGLVWLHEPEPVAPGLEAHVGQLGQEGVLLFLIPAHEKGLAFIYIAARLEIRVGSWQREFSMYCFVNILYFQRKQAAFLIEEKLGIVCCRLKYRLHDPEEFLLLVQLGRR